MLHDHSTVGFSFCFTQKNREYFTAARTEQIVESAFSQLVITRVSVTAFADLKRYHQGHLIGMQLSFTQRLI